MGAQGFEGRYRVFDHGDIVGLQDGGENAQDGTGVEGQIAGAFFYECFEDF